MGIVYVVPKVVLPLQFFSLRYFQLSFWIWLIMIVMWGDVETSSIIVFRSQTLGKFLSLYDIQSLNYSVTKCCLERLDEAICRLRSENVTENNLRVFSQSKPANFSYKWDYFGRILNEKQYFTIVSGNRVKNDLKTYIFFLHCVSFLT